MNMHLHMCIMYTYVYMHAVHTYIYRHVYIHTLACTHIHACTHGRLLYLVIEVVIVVVLQFADESSEEGLELGAVIVRQVGLLLWQCNKTVWYAAVAIHTAHNNVL